MPVELMLVDRSTADNRTDEELIAAAKKDSEAFAALYDRYSERVANYVYSRTLDRHLTEDLTSATFYAALRNLRWFRWRRIPFVAWLYRIASNQVAMHYRSASRREPGGVQGQTCELVRGPSELPAQTMAPDDVAAASEEFASVRAAVETLDEKYRTVVMLRFFEGMTIPEIAAIVGRREGTVKSQLHRALRALEPILSARGLGEAETN